MLEEEEKEEEIPEEEEKQEDIEESEGQLEESIEDFSGGMTSEEFARFLQSGPETTAPVLDKVEEFREPEQPNLEQDITGFQGPKPEQSFETQKVENEPRYIMGKENPYHLPQTNVEPSALTADRKRIKTVFPEGMLRRQLFDPGLAVRGFEPPEGELYPEMLRQEKIDNKKYMEKSY